MAENCDFIAVQEGADRNFLRAVELDMVDRETCIERYEPIKDVTPRMVCAGLGGGKNACKGDSGGALVVKKSGKQLGIVSWSLGCAEPYYPGVFANVADKEIHDFIDSELEQVAVVHPPN